jgi:peptide-methionine (S)-S-oxide reductase
MNNHKRILRNAFYTALLLLPLVIPLPATADKAIFAGGCFWCMESDFEKLNGVNEVISGFTGGTLVNPTYNGNHTGHYEAVEVDYDSNTLSYQDLLDHFWINIDPFDDKGQFCDKGFSYLSAIFVEGDKQRDMAKASKEKVIKQFPNQKVVTPILTASTFYPIKGNESAHQDYYKNNPLRYKYYRWGCGRDQRLDDIWGEQRKHLPSNK